LALPSGFDPNPLAPKILIHDTSGVLQYTYETSATNTSPTQDFELAGMTMHLGVNADYGTCVLLINDNNNTLTDTSLRKAAKIKRQWTVQVYLGKSSSSLNRYFYGKIFTTTVRRPKTNLQQIMITAVGWGVTLKDRVTNMKRYQAKAADGITVDTTDNAAKISELVKDLVEDTDHLADTGLTTPDNIGVGQVADTDIKLANVQENFGTMASSISKLATAGNMTWGVDPDRDLILRDPTEHDSGFLFTNNVDGYDSQNWTVGKLGFLRNTLTEWTDASYETAYSILHGIGSNKDTKDISITGSENATRSSNTSWIAIPFTPNVDNIARFALKLAKNGTPPSDAQFEIIGADSSGNPNRNDIRIAMTVAKEFLQALTGTATFKEIGFDKFSINPLDKLFLVVHQNGDSLDNFTFDYQTGTGTFYTSSDGDTWASATGNFSLRTYVNKAINIILENTAAKRRYGTREKVLTFGNGLHEATAREALLQAGQILGLERRVYSNVIISPPTDRIPLAKYCRIQDVKTGLDIKANIISIDVEMIATRKTALGATFVSLGLEEIHY